MIQPTWQRRWSRIEELLDSEYSEWPPSERCFLVANLLSYGTMKRLRFHPELIDQYNVPLGGEDAHLARMEQEAVVRRPKGKGKGGPK